MCLKFDVIEASIPIHSQVRLQRNVHVSCCAVAPVHNASANVPSRLRLSAPRTESSWSAACALHQRQPVWRVPSWPNLLAVAWSTLRYQAIESILSRCRDSAYHHPTFSDIQIRSTGSSMTGYTVHTGASKKFVSGWDRIFQAAEKPAASKTAKSTAKAKSKKKKQS